VHKLKVDFRSKQRKVAEERRMETRLEFHCDATVMGLSGIQTITDISPGGFYLKGDIADRFDIGQNKTINVKLPSEKYVTKLKAIVKHKSYRGIGCQLAKQNGRERVIWSKFFKFYNFFKDINTDHQYSS
jgi:hypothetical protein